MVKCLNSAKDFFSRKSHFKFGGQKQGTEVFSKGKLILKGIFGVFNSTKNDLGSN
jgi:hypothetical protein